MEIWISKSKSSKIVALRANCWFLWFSNFFWSWKQKFLMKSHFLCCSKCFGQSKIFRTRLKYFYFGLQVFWIYRKIGQESRMFWKLLGYFWENSNFNLQLKKLDCMHQFGTVIYETSLMKDKKYKRWNDWHIPSIFCNYLQ